MATLGRSIDHLRGKLRRLDIEATDAKKVARRAADAIELCRNFRDGSALDRHPLPQSPAPRDISRDRDRGQPHQRYVRRNRRERPRLDALR